MLRWVEGTMVENIVIYEIRRGLGEKRKYKIVKQVNRLSDEQVTMSRCRPK